MTEKEFVFGKIWRSINGSRYSPGRNRCPSCLKNGWRILVAGNPVTVIQCRKCGFVKWVKALEPT
jgi:Zn ribbon nucleic-acid-binding protein